MRTTMTATARIGASLTLLALAGARATAAAQAGGTQVWQADVQVRVLEVVKASGTLTARVVIYTGNDDDALDTRLLIFVPVGAGIDRVPPGCLPASAPSLMPSLRGMVQCAFGLLPGWTALRDSISLPGRSPREVAVRQPVPTIML